MRGASEPSPKKKIEGGLYCDRPRLAAEDRFFYRVMRYYIEPLLRGSSTNQHNDRVSMTNAKPHRWQFASLQEVNDMVINSDGKIAYSRSVHHVSGTTNEGKPFDATFRITDV